MCGTLIGRNFDDILWVDFYTFIELIWIIIHMLWKLLLMRMRVLTW